MYCSCSNPITIRVEYQWTPSRCKVCKCFGHDCNKKPFAPPLSIRPLPSHHLRPSQTEKRNPSPKVAPQLEASDEGLWTEVARKGKAKATVTKNTSKEPARLSSPPASPGQGIITSNSFNGFIPYVCDSDALLTNENGTQSVILDDSVSCPLETIGVDTVNDGPSEDSRGKRVVRQVVIRNNSFQALQYADEVGVAMNRNKTVQDISIDSDFIEDLDEHRGVLVRGSIDLESPSSSRQKKKEAKKKCSGNRPKGRHKT